MAETGTFLSRDPVESEPPYIYAKGNPANLKDPSGFCAEVGDEACWGIYEQIVFLCPECKYMVRSTSTGDRNLHEENVWYLNYVLENVQNGWRPTYLAVPSFLDDANGYVEGQVTVSTFLGCVWTISGEEIVYDFASRQRQKFTYTEARGYQKGLPIIPPGLAFSLGGASTTKYGGFLWGFSGQGVVGDYRGYFVGTSLGVSSGVINIKSLEVGPALGWGQFTGAGTESNPWAAVNGRGVVRGQVVYFGGGASGTKSSSADQSKISSVLKWPIDASLTGTFYAAAEDRAVDYYEGNELPMLREVRSGAASPVSVPTSLRNFGAMVGANIFIKNGWITDAEYGSIMR